MRATAWGAIGACLALYACLGLPAARAAELTALVKNQDGKPVPNAVVIAVPASGAIRLPQKRVEEVIDQVDREFVPYVKPVLVGTAVRFPNKDNIRHHVYSFSPAKRFQLPLYAGTPASPVLFDKTGVVVLGCNIHDWMIGYVYVSESPWFAKTGADGTALLRNLPAGAYRVRVWQPQMAGPEEQTVQAVDLSGASARAQLNWEIRVKSVFLPRRAPAGLGGGRY